MSKSTFDFDDFVNQYVDEVVDGLFNFDKKAYRFNRDEKDMYPYSIVRKKDSLIMTHNVLGIAKEDLKVRIEEKNWEHYLVIKGASKDEITGKNYSINSRFSYNPDEIDVSKAKSELKNGILYITIPYKEQKKIEGSIQEIDIK